MIDLNKTMIVGRLTRDPEMKHMQSGAALASFSIAVNRRRKDKQTGEYVEDVSFFDCEAWERSAEFIEKYFAKGKAIFVEGRLKQDTWEKDGQKRSKVVIVAERVSFAETRAEQEARSGSSSDAPGSPPSGSPPSGGNAGGQDRTPQGNGPEITLPEPERPKPQGPTDEDLPF